MKHNKKWNPLLNLLINCILAEYTLHMLSLKMNLHCFLLKFQITGLCNSTTSCWFNIISLLIAALAEETWFFWVGDFYPKICKPLKLLWHLSYFG